MSDRLPLHRILVALDDSPDGRAALEAAAQLAAEVRAELQGLFVEDVNLLRLAGLPFASEVCSSSAAQRPLTLDAVERSLRAMATQVRGWIEHTAQRSQLPWSFQVARGPVVTATLEAADEADLVLIGVHSLAPRHADRPREGRPRAAKGPQPVLVLFDGTESAGRTLRTAERLTRERNVPLDVYIVADDPSETAALQNEAEAILGRAAAHTVVHAVPVRDAGQLIEITRRRQAQLLLFNRDSSLLDPPTLATLVNELDCPVGIVR